MKELSQHIAFLLRRHDCVIVPSVGAFMAGRRKAVFNPEGGVVLPPSTEVIFNAAIVNNDGLLVNSYSRRHSLPFAAATRMLDADIARLRETLGADRKVTLPAIGTLTLGEEGNMVFMPERSPEASSARLGMAPLTLRTVASREAEKVATQDTAGDDGISKAPVRLDKPLRSDKYYYIAINKVFARVAAMLILVVGVALGVILPQTGGAGDAGTRDCASVIPIVTTSRPAPQKTHPAPAPAPQKPRPEQLHYMLVVGTFTTQQEIDRFMDKYSGSEFPLELVKGRKYTYAVAAADDDIANVRSLMKNPEFTSTFPQAWISENK